MNDRIEKRLELKAPPARVWRALTDYREFGAWFRVKLDGPFVPGQPAEGQITHPGYEHVRWKAVVQKMEPERLFSFTWHPYAIDPAVDYSGETPTLVEFRLEPTRDGTLLLLTESGFARRRHHAAVFAALGDETRLALVAALASGAPRSIAQLTGGSRITRQAITKHLRVLQSAGVVRCARRGRQSLFELDPAPLAEMQAYLGRVAEQWDQMLERLKSLVES